jgi:iron complex outermembrane receptor protein
MSNSLLKKISSSFIIFLSLETLAHAVDLPNSDLSLEDELKFLAAERHVVVTASKHNEDALKTIATTTVITQADILQMGARNIIDVLKLVPGVGITQSFLGINQIEMRGVTSLASEKVLMMLNGHPLDHNLQNAGSTWLFDDTPISNIKRVEVVRGPASALYGANAFMGVINIITKDAKDINGYEMSVGNGSFGTQQYNGAWGKQFANTAEAALNFNYTSTNGIKSPIVQDAYSVANLPSYAPGTSQLHQGRYDGQWKLGYKSLKFDGSFVNKQGGAFFGGGPALSPNNAQNYTDLIARLTHSWEVVDKFTITTQVFRDYFKFDNTFMTFSNQQYQRTITEDTRIGGEIQGDYIVTENQHITAGYSYNEDHQGGNQGELDSSFQGQVINKDLLTFDRTRKRYGVYVQDVWDPIPSMRISVGGRYDHFSDFGGTFNPRMGYNWEFIKNYSIKSSYGTAYRAPAFGEMDANNAILAGNPNIMPEIVTTFEAGLIGKPIEPLELQATYYHSNIQQIITGVPTPSGAQQYGNSGSMLSEGVEMEGRYEFSGALLGSFISSNVVYQHAQLAYEQAPDVPRIRANVMMNWAYDRQWSAYGHVLFKDSTYRAIGDSRANVPAFATLDLSLLGKQLIKKNIDVSFTIYNLLDTIPYDANTFNFSPQPTNDYQMPGRSFFGRINLKF